MKDTILLEKNQYAREELCYLADPCGSSALPFWKEKKLSLPAHLSVFHKSQWETFSDREKERYSKISVYFRLIHDLINLDEVSLPKGYVFKAVAFDEDLEKIPAFIEMCYRDLVFPLEAIKKHLLLDVYEPSLWFWILGEQGEAAALCIADLDKRMGEGILEWIQVHPEHRKKGLGRALVLKALEIIKKKADFATVSGNAENATNPLSLYRSCGFTGRDVWFICEKDR